MLYNVCDHLNTSVVFSIVGFSNRHELLYNVYFKSCYFLTCILHCANLHLINRMLECPSSTPYKVSRHSLHHFPAPQLNP